MERFWVPTTLNARVICVHWRTYQHQFTGDNVSRIRSQFEKVNQIPVSGSGAAVSEEDNHNYKYDWVIGVQVECTPDYLVKDGDLWQHFSLSFPVEFLATANYGAQKLDNQYIFLSSVGVWWGWNESYPWLFCCQWWRSYLGKLGKPSCQLLYHYYLLPSCILLQYNVNGMKCRSSLPFCGLDVFWSVKRFTSSTCHQVHRRIWL